MFFFIVVIFSTKVRDYGGMVCNLYHYVFDPADQSTLLINRCAINCVAINPADAVYHEVIDTEY
jgi:predicted GNAT superfamily acetyltransferase